MDFLKSEIKHKNEIIASLLAQNEKYQTDRSSENAGGGVKPGDTGGRPNDTVVRFVGGGGGGCHQMLCTDSVDTSTIIQSEVVSCSHVGEVDIVDEQPASNGYSCHGDEQHNTSSSTTSTSTSTRRTSETKRASWKPTGKVTRSDSMSRTLTTSTTRTKTPTNNNNSNSNNNNNNNNNNSINNNNNNTKSATTTKVASRSVN